MTDTNEVEFVGWSMSGQFAVDKDDNIWRVDGWFDHTEEYDMVPVDHPSFDETWSMVLFVSLWCILDGDKRWAVIFPDDFNLPSEA